MYPFRFPAIWLTMGWLLIALVVLLSVLPDFPSPMPSEPRFNFAHLFAYLVLMVWFASIYPQEHHRFRLSVSFIVMGVCLEFLQRLIPGRTFMLSDILFNGLGVVVGWTLADTLLPAYISKLDGWLFHVSERVRGL